MSYQSDILARTPLRYYPLNETSGITADNIAASGPDATYLPNNGTSFTGGTLNQTGLNPAYGAVQFGGNGSVWINETILDNATNFSLLFSLNPGTGGDFKTIFSRYIDNSTRLEVSLGDTGVFGTDLGLIVTLGQGYCLTSGNVFNANTQHQVLITYDGAAGASSRFKLYINGTATALSNDTIPSSVPAMASTPAYIGSRRNLSEYLSGTVQDFVIFGSTLTASDATALQESLNPTSVNAVLTDVVVGAVGAGVALTFDQNISLLSSQVTLRINNVLTYVSGVTGSGTSWTVNIGKKYILPTDTVSVTVGAVTLTATNNSNISREQVKYAGRNLGMFIHFGIETFDPANPTNPEWSLPSVNQNVFAPTGSMNTAIDQWIESAIAANMRYMVLTAKHHYGFTLWPSASGSKGVQYTDWYAANNNLDIIDSFTTRVRAAGLGVGIYFSIWDRSFETGSPTAQQYINHTVTQLTELLTNYGQIDSLWFDGYAWANNPSLGVPYSTIPYQTIYDTVKNLQPNCIIVNNNHEFTLTNSDIVTYELPANVEVPANNIFPAEASSTISAANTWFHHENDTSVKSAGTINSLITSVNNARLALLLNVPPVRTGLLSPGAQILLSEIGHNQAEFVLDPPGEGTGAPLYGPGFGGNFVGSGGSLGGG